MNFGSKMRSSYRPAKKFTNTGYGSARVLFVSSASGNDTDAANNITANGHYLQDFSEVITREDDQKCACKKFIKRERE